MPPDPDRKSRNHRKDDRQRRNPRRIAALGTRLETRIEASRADLMGKIDVTVNGTGRTEPELGTVKADVREVKAAVERIDKKFDRLETRIEALESRS